MFTIRLFIDNIQWGREGARGHVFPVTLTFGGSDSLANDLLHAGLWYLAHLCLLIKSMPRSKNAGATTDNIGVKNPSV